MKVKVNAKINLSLNVYECVGGYHKIDSVVTSVDIFDIVTVTARSDSLVTVSGCVGVETLNNTAYKAAAMFVSRFSSNGVDIHITKGIPTGAGLGGSSADAAATVFCMSKIFGVDIGDVSNICRTVGSDVSFMLQGGAARLKGKGDDVTFFSLPKPIYFAVTTFDEPSSTAEAYRKFDEVGGDCSDCALMENLLQSGDYVRAFSMCSNGLQRAFCGMSCCADGYLQFAASQGYSTVMTGSGSAFYVPFDNLADAVRAEKDLISHGFNARICKSSSGMELL